MTITSCIKGFSLPSVKPLERYRRLLNLFDETTSCFFDVGDNLLMGRTILTPQAAREINSHHQPLREDGSIANRKIIYNNLTRIQSAIAEGTFILTGETIIFDDALKLIDGRHRVEGVIAANEAIDTLIVIGVPNSTFQYLDQGASRTPSTVLQLLGYTCYRDVASACRAFITFQTVGTFDAARRNGSKSQGTALAIKLGSNHQTVELVESHPDLKEAVYYLRSFRQASALLRHRGPMSAVTYALKQADPVLLETFLKILNSKDEELPAYAGPEYSPILMLRGRLSRDRKLPIDDTAALWIKAWNMVRLGQTRQNLIWKCNEDFPQIHGLAYNTQGAPLDI